MDIAAVRTLRLALGAALAIGYSQAVAWDMSFVAPVFVIVVLSLPAPALPLKTGLGFVLVLALAVYAGLVLLPMLVYQIGAGILILALLLFWSFYHPLRGGPALIGTFATIGLSLTVAIGRGSVDLFLDLAALVTINAAVGIAFVWLAHALMPDSKARSTRPLIPAAPPPAPPLMDISLARLRALRSLVVVMPVCIWLLLWSDNAAAYVPFMIKVASMGQQTSTQDTAHAAKSLIMSTIIGGVGAIIAWQVLSLWPSLIMYTLVVGLAGLIIGPRIFRGQGLAPDGATWSYGYMTLMVILAPAVMDSIGGDSADAKFWERLLMFFQASLYGVGAVMVFDAFWPARGQQVSSKPS